jgi:hypothetical protein
MADCVTAKVPGVADDQPYHLVAPIVGQGMAGRHRTKEDPLDTFWRIVAQGLAGETVRRHNEAETQPLETEETEEGPAEAEPSRS